MTIESTRSQNGAKTASVGAHRATAKSAHSGAAGASADQGFAGVMGLLATADNSDATSDTTVASSALSTVPDAAVPGMGVLLSMKDVVQKSDGNMPLALDDKGVSAINTKPLTITAEDAVAARSSALQAADKRRSSDKADAALTTTPGAEASVKGQDTGSDLSTLLKGKSASVSSGVSQMQAELREVRTLQPVQAPVAVPDASRLAAAMVSANGETNASERSSGKPQGRASGSGMEGLLGAAMADKLGINPTYEVAPTTAVVPDTQVAETVSYWATQGVQNAELTLDGLGKDPVEVRISVDGDQTQVDFRTNQPEVRQALENASAQLRDMLSGQGLQLAGMSIGTSARGQTPGDSGQPKPSPRQTKLVSIEPAAIPVARAPNPSVGRALDLYV